MQYALQQRTLSGGPIADMGEYSRSGKPYIEITLVDKNERFLGGEILTAGVYRGAEKIRSVSVNEKELISLLFGIDYVKFTKSL